MRGEGWSGEEEGICCCVDILTFFDELKAKILVVDTGWVVISLLDITERT